MYLVTLPQRNITFAAREAILGVNSQDPGAQTIKINGHGGFAWSHHNDCDVKG